VGGGLRMKSLPNKRLTLIEKLKTLKTSTMNKRGLAKPIWGGGPPLSKGGKRGGYFLNHFESFGPKNGPNIDPFGLIFKILPSVGFNVQI
jgi:hypothetical protein